MADYKNIYQTQADAYAELVSAEDHEGHLARTLRTLLAPADKTVVEVGAGTGRVTRILLDLNARHVVATELESSMLQQAQKTLADQRDRVRFAEADARRIPVDDKSADLYVAGWVLAHFRSWHPSSWKSEIRQCLDEADRVATDHIAIIDTLGTGHNTPTVSSELAEYHAWLEETQGFERTELRTDYKFASSAEAERVLPFFFGDRIYAHIPQGAAPVVVPECTGLWTRKAR